MTVEAELAQLLIRMGAERGLDLETVLSEMAQAPLPSFVDADAVRGSMLEAVESWWRADLEERLEQLRRQFQIGGLPSASVSPAASRPTPPPFGAPAVTPSRPAPAVQSASAGSNPAASKPVASVEDATIHDELEPAVNESAEALPRDATMIWNTNHG